MTKQEVRAWIEETGVIAAVRERSTENALFAADAVVQERNSRCGDRPYRASSHDGHLAIWPKAFPGIVVGAGSVTNPEAAQKCLDAGAQFLTSDGFHPASRRVRRETGRGRNSGRADSHRSDQRLGDEFGFRQGRPVRPAWRSRLHFIPACDVPKHPFDRLGRRRSTDRI